MEFDLGDLKESIPEEQFSGLDTYVTSLRQQIENLERKTKGSTASSINLKQQIKESEAKLADTLERLGLSSYEEIEDLPDIRGQGEANKQLEAKIKRLTADLDAKTQAAAELESKLSEMRRDQVIAQATAKYTWAEGAREIVDTYFRTIATQDGEEWLAAGGDGIPITLQDAVDQFAKAKPALLASKGAAGDGYSSSRSAGQTKPFSEMSIKERSELYRNNPRLFNQMQEEEKASRRTGATPTVTLAG